MENRLCVASLIQTVEVLVCVGMSAESQCYGHGREQGSLLQNIASGDERIEMATSIADAAVRARITATVSCGFHFKGKLAVNTLVN